MTAIGLISDTHGLLRREAVAALAGSDYIIHAGDIGDAAILERLRTIAPVIAVRGNTDTAEWAREIPQTQVVEVAGKLFYVLHALGELDIEPAAAGIDVVVSGHSHRPEAEMRGGVLFLNPGSAGPRRFTLPVSVARVVIDGPRLVHKMVELVVRPAV
jgi:putative phosphoesterase